MKVQRLVELRAKLMMDYYVSSKVEQRGILVGMLLGAGKRDQQNFYLQNLNLPEEYLLFKKQLLEQIIRKPVSLKERKTKNGTPLIRLEPKLIPLTRVLVKRFYQGTKPRITKQFLEFLTLPGIAIWFMDKGSKSFKRKNGKIHSLEVNFNTNICLAENELIVTYFAEVWGFKWGLSKSKNAHRLRMGTKEGKRFFSFLRPYIHPSMLYKVETSCQHNGRHLKEFFSHGEGIVQRVRKLTQI